MPPHGPGLYGALHSHDPEFPDDAWNLYSMLDRSTTSALNVTRPDHVLGIFRPHVLRLAEEPNIVSDAGMYLKNCFYVVRYPTFFAF